MVFVLCLRVNSRKRLKLPKNENLQIWAAEKATGSANTELCLAYIVHYPPYLPPHWIKIDQGRELRSISKGYYFHETTPTEALERIVCYKEQTNQLMSLGQCKSECVWY